MLSNVLLPQPGRAEQAHELAPRDVERDVVQRVQGIALCPEDLGHVVEGDRGRVESSTGGLVEDSTTC